MFDSVEKGRCFCVDPATYKWEDLPSMNQDRRFAACTKFKDKIYVFGGRDLSTNYRLRTAEVFDSDLGEWSFTADMVHVRSHHKVVAVKEKIFVFGGGNKFNYEVFDVQNSSFTLLQSPAWKQITCISTRF